MKAAVEQRQRECGNNSEGSSESNWTEEQTTLIGGGNVNIDAKRTEVHGAVVANAVRNGDTLTDLGNLNLITDELVVTDLHDTDVSENSGINMSVSVSVGSDKKGSPEFSSNSSSLGLTNQGHRKEQTTAGTLGGGSITRRDGSEHELGDTNRDLDQRQVVTLDQQTGGLDATFELDHRVLSKEGLEDIKENFEDTYEHGEDIGRAAHTVATDERASLLSFGSNVHNNSQLTQLKNELVRNPAYQSVLAGLNSKDPEQYQQAMQVVGQLAQDKFGLNPTDIQFYDGGETTSSSLADVDGLTDRKGGTVTAANHAESGNIFIDGGDGASKTDMANTLGHEVLESQMQQGQGGGLFGTPSGEAKESLADALGAQMQDRLNQAAGGNLDSTGGADFSAALASSAGVRAGTERANNVGGATVENRQLYTDEAKAILDHAPAYANEHGMSEDDARRELTRQALREIDDKWAGQIAENPAAREAIQQLRVSTPPINDSYVEGGQVDAFVATPDDKANPYINANAARMQEEYGTAGVDNFLTKNALEEGQTLPELTPLDQITESVTGTAADIAKFAGAMAEDPSGTMGKVTDAVSNAVSGCVNAGIACVMSHNPREGNDGDKAFVDLLQGDRESAIENNNAALAGEALPGLPVVVKAGQSVLSVMDKAVPDGTRTNVDVEARRTTGETDDFYQQDPNSGEYYWPGNLGFKGEPTKATLETGTVIDRYGSESGAFLSDSNSTFSQRALGPGDGVREYHQYEVIKPIPVIQGPIEPAFGKEGGGQQMLPNFEERRNVQWMLDNGYIREINTPESPKSSVKNYTDQTGGKSGGDDAAPVQKTTNETHHNSSSTATKQEEGSQSGSGGGHLMYTLG